MTESKGDRISAVVVWQLTRSVHMAKLYLMSKGSQSLSADVGAVSEPIAALTLIEWTERHTDDVLAALSDIEHPRRCAVDAFLVRSLVAEYVYAQNRKGVTVPTSTAIDFYIRLWMLRPVPALLQDHLVRLTHHRNTRRKFGQLLRKEWMLEVATHRLATALSIEETIARATVSRSTVVFVALVDLGDRPSVSFAPCHSPTHLLTSRLCDAMCPLTLTAWHGRRQ